MAGGMVRIRNADLRIRTIALLARELEGDHARDIRLKRQNLQVEHELGVIGERGGDAHRPIGIGHRVCQLTDFLGALDFALDLPNAVEVLVHSRAVASAHTLLELGDVPGERIEQTGSILERRPAGGGVAALAKQAFEDDARMRLGRKRSRGRRPGKAILIDARVTVVAHTGERVQIHRELQRRQLRLAAHLLGRDLVDGRAQVIVGALGVFGGRGAQKRRVGGVVRSRIRVLQPQYW